MDQLAIEILTYILLLFFKFFDARTIFFCNNRKRTTYNAARDIVQKIITKLDEQSCLLFLQYKMSEANQSIIKLRGYVFHPISQCNDANFLPPYLIDF